MPGNPRSLAVIALVVLAVRTPMEPVHLVAENVAYGTAAAQVLDVHAPQEDGSHPSIIVIHGGRWRSGDKADTRSLAEHLAAQGFVAVNMNYRLSGYPDPVDDVRAAISWVETHVATYGGDPARIGALGVSAGGHLALLVAMRDGAVDAVVSWSGPTDLLTLPSVEPAIERFLGCDLSVLSCRLLAEAASPRHQVNQGDPPTFLANGTNEIIPKEQATQMAAALAAQSVPHQLLLIEGDGHGTGLSRSALGPTDEFLQAMLGSSV
jgi:acetyl esterase/lipase